jgi:hypothetical protein
LDLIGAGRLPYLSRRNYHYEFMHLIPWGMLVGVIEGNAGAIILKRTFEGGDFLIATATATPVGSLLFSSIWGALCVGRPKRRLATIFGSATALCAATIAFTPRTPTGAILFVIQMASAQIFLSAVVTVRAALWRHNYPPYARGTIAGRLQAIRMLVGIGSLILAAYLFDHDPTLYRWLYPFVAVCGLFAMVLFQKLHVRHEKSEIHHGADAEPGAFQSISPVQALSPSYVTRQIARLLKADPRFARYLLFQMCLGVSVQIVGPVLVDVVGDATSGYRFNILILDVVPKAMMFISIRYWGRMFDRIGVLRFRVHTGSCAAGGLLLGLMATAILVGTDAGESAVTLALAMFFARSVLHGLHQGGGTLAWNLGHLHFTKGREADVYMGVHQTLTGVRGLVSPYIGMFLFAWIGWGVWAVSIALCLISIAGFRSLDLAERREKAMQ